jgi:hypothetical protein
LGESFVLSDWSGRNDTVCGWYPLSAIVTDISPPAWTVSSQGVRQLCPWTLRASAPGGSDSIRTMSVGGDDFKKSRLGMEAEHAATVKPHATTAMTRLMIGPQP